MAGGRSLPVYSTGTVTVSQVAGVWTVAGIGTNFIAPDGVANFTLLEGDNFVIPNVGEGTVASVASATGLTLDTWSGAAVTSATAYKIYRYEGLPSNAVVALLNYLLTLLTDANPPTSMTVDTGAVRVKIDDDGSGDLRIRVRPSDQPDSAYASAITINGATGVPVLAGKPAPQTLTITGQDTVAALASAWPSGWTPIIALNRLFYSPPDFAISGTTVTWSPTNAGTADNPLHLEPGMTAVLFAV